MKYYSKEILEHSHLNKNLDIIDEIEPSVTEGKTVPASINVRFCRDCPLYELDYWQPDPNIKLGWCRRMSYYRTLDNEEPYYVYVNSNSFCNEDDITEEDE